MQSPSPRAEPLRQTAAAPASPVLSQAHTAPESTPQDFILSATLGERAWIRVGDRRTLAVKAGDEVPGLGRIAQVGVNSVTLESGQTLKSQP